MGVGQKSSSKGERWAWIGGEMGVVDTLTHFSQETSIHGLAYVGKKSSSKGKRWTWMGLFIGSLIYAFVQIKYLSQCKSTAEAPLEIYNRGYNNSTRKIRECNFNVFKGWYSHLCCPWTTKNGH